MPAEGPVYAMIGSVSTVSGHILQGVTVGPIVGDTAGVSDGANVGIEVCKAQNKNYAALIFKICFQLIFQYN